MVKIDFHFGEYSFWRKCLYNIIILHYKQTTNLLSLNIKWINWVREYSHFIRSHACILKRFTSISLLPIKFLISFRIHELFLERNASATICSWTARHVTTLIVFHYFTSVVITMWIQQGCWKWKTFHISSFNI